MSTSPQAVGPSRGGLITNATVSVIAYVIYLPVSLLVNAYAVHRIGLEAFGIWAALTTIVGFGELLDLGVTTPLIKYVADSIALGQWQEVNSLLSTAMALFLIVGTAFGVGMTLAADWILAHIFHSAHDAALYRLYLAVVFGFVVSLTFSVLRSLLAGLQRPDINARLSLGYNLASAAGIVVVLSLGLRVNGLVLVWLTTTILAILANWLMAKRLFPQLSLNPMHFTLNRLKKILSFSLKVQVTSIAFTLNDQLDRTLIAYALGPSLLGSYQLAQRAAVSLRGISYSLMSGVLPAASNLAALGEHERIRLLYLRASRYLAVTLLAACIDMAALAHPLVTAWLGSGHDRVAVTLIIMLIAYAIGTPCYATAETLNGIGRPEIRLRADVVVLPAHAILSVVLLWRFGYYGTLIGTSIAYTLSRLYLYWAGSVALGVSPLQLVRYSFLSPLTGALIAAAGAIALQVGGAPLTLPALIVELVVVGCLYLGYMAAFGFDQYDRELIGKGLSALAMRLGMS